MFLGWPMRLWSNLWIRDSDLGIDFGKRRVLVGGTKRMRNPQSKVKTPKTASTGSLVRNIGRLVFTT